MKFKSFIIAIALIASQQLFSKETITIALFRGTAEVPLRVDGKTYYQILGVKPDATNQEIAKAYAQATLNKIKYAGPAFDVLAHSGNRKKYDEALKSTDSLIEEFELIERKKS